MTYIIKRDETEWWIEDADGAKIGSNQPLPVKTPDDIIDILLEDMGVGKPQKEAFRTLFLRDWEIVTVETE